MYIINQMFVVKMCFLNINCNKYIKIIRKNINLCFIIKVKQERV